MATTTGGRIITADAYGSRDPAGDSTRLQYAWAAFGGTVLEQDGARCRVQFSAEELQADPPPFLLLEVRTPDGRTRTRKYSVYPAILGPKPVVVPVDEDA